MTAIVPDPDSYRSEKPVAQYRANPLTAPSESAVQESLQAVSDQCAEAACIQQGGLCPEIDMLVVSQGEGSSAAGREAATDELYIRLYEHGLLDEMDTVTEALPDPFQHIDGTPASSISEIITKHSDSSLADRPSDYLVDHDQLVAKFAETADRLLTVRPGQIALPRAETDLSLPPSADRRHTDPDKPRMKRIEFRHEADWELHPVQDFNQIGQRYTANHRPNYGMLRSIIEAIEDLNIDVVCQIHLEFAYEVDGHPITPSRATDVAGTFETEAQIEASSEVGFSFRLFAFGDTSASELDGQLQKLGTQLAPRFPEQYVPALFSSNEAIAHHAQRLTRGRGLEHSEPHNQLFRRPIAAISDWLSLPSNENWYAAGRFLPVGPRFLANRDDDATLSQYSLGRDPMLNRSVVLPEGAPQRHLICSNSARRREILLSQHIELSRRTQQAPVIILDWDGSLQTAYFNQVAETKLSQVVKRHALIDVANIPLADSPRQFTNPATLVEDAMTQYEIEDARTLYSTLLLNYVREFDYSPIDHLDDVLAGLSAVPGSAVSHADLVREVEHHCPAPALQTGTTVGDQIGRTKAAKAALEEMEDELPTDLFGDLSATFDFAEQEIPATAVIWVDLSQVETRTGKRLTGTLLLDAIARHTPTADSSIDATVVYDDITRFNLTDAVVDQLVGPHNREQTTSGLRLVAGKNLRDTSVASRSQLENGAIKTVDTRNDNSSDPPTAIKRSGELAKQHATEQSAVVIPPAANPDADRRKTLSPVTPPTSTETDTNIPEQLLDRLRAHGNGITPDPSATSIGISDHRPYAIHPSRREKLFSDQSSPSRDDTTLAEQAMSDASQQSLRAFTTIEAMDEFACRTCGTRYHSIGEAIRCHGSHTQQNKTATTGTGSESIAYPREFVDRILGSAANDQLTEFLRNRLTDPSTTLDPAEAYDPLRDGLLNRIDDTTYGDILPSTLAFFQAVELFRIGQFSPSTTTKDLQRTFLSETGTTIDDLRGQYLTTHRDATGKQYYKLTDLAYATPITRISTSEQAPSIPGLDNPLPMLKATRALSEQFQSAKNVSRIEYYHRPEPCPQTFPLKVIDVAGLDKHGQLVKAGIGGTRATLDRINEKVIRWAADIPAEVTLIVEKEDASTRRETATVAQTIAEQAANTKHADLGARRKPLTETQYRVDKITEMISWAETADLTIQSTTSLLQ